MDVDPDKLIDLVERRRLQNRVAQRKFREKKRREARNAFQNGSHQQSSGSPSALPSASSINSDCPQTVSLASLRAPLTKVPDAIPTELPNTAFEQGRMNAHIDLDTVDYLPRELSNEPFLLPTTPSFQSEFVVPNLDPSTVVRTFSPEQCDTSFIDIAGGHLDSWLGDSRPGAPFMPSGLSDYDTHHGPSLSHNDNSLPGLIISSKDDGWISSLHIAAQAGHEQIVQALLQHNATDINKADSDGRTALIHAVVENNQSIVCLLLGRSARIGASDCDGRSALHWAVLYRRIEILEVLLKHREKHEASLDIDTHDSTGWTPLHMAVRRAFEPGVLMLIQSGADINAKASKCPYTGNVMPLLKGQQ
ncbi:ankyrin repeat-containing domain protein [Penicillium pulvis]|uniref:ankyrin repeat-containing domain protein n=1 Tax=Penicillium pulvis TaxID=1562058 RepID=UPI00254918A7|nr:ankyrin repeat-containing domain protein [Penicillium pulvis]KAJ5802598.1 ankyrin repeat-containing domain protein [Penicillium pulvis]